MKAGSGSRPLRRKGRAWQWLAGAGFALVVGLAGAWCADRLLPPDLTRFEDRSTVVLDAEGGLLRAFLAEDGIWRLEAAPGAVNARFLALLKTYEDKRFDRHWGVDPLAVGRATGQWIGHGEVVSGASTLTMQAARLLEPRPRGVGAKLIQMLRAVQLEWRYSKHEILRIYLTLAPYGGNLEGVRAASLAYFGKEPEALTIGEAALLVALPQSPERLRPDRHPQAAAAGRAKVLRRLRDAGVITAQEFSEAMAEPIPDRRQAFPFHAPRLARRLAAQAPPGAMISTPIDRTLQREIEAFATRHAQGFADPASVAIMVVENATRQVIGYLGGDDFWGPAGHVDLARAVRSPGSTLKPFIYGLALDDLAIHPETLIEDRPMRFGAYAPRNFDRGFQGTVTIRTALQQSLNVPAVAVLDHVGPDRFVASLRQAGVRLSLPADAGGASLPVALGGAGVTLSDLTMLFAGLANGGRVEPLVFTSGTERARARRLFGEAAAWYVTDMLRGAPLPDGWGRARNIVRDRQIAFKTGTSYGFRDAWTLGSSPRYTVGVWVGRADATARPGHFGRNDAAPVMLKVFSLLPAEPPEMAPPPETVLTVRGQKELPPGLRRFAATERDAMDPAATPPPRLAYPPHGARVRLPADNAPLPLRAEAGTGRLTWVVNGAVLAGDTGDGRLAHWRPDGEGFVTVSVIDQEGRSARAVFRISP